MKKFLGLALAGALSVALVGCGNDEDQQRRGFQNGVGAPQGPCSPEQVDGYNKFARACNQLNAGMRDNRTATICENAALEYLQRSQGRSCVALVANGQVGPNYQQQPYGYQGQYPGQYQGGYHGGYQRGYQGGWQYNDSFLTQYQGQQAMIISDQPMQQVLAIIAQMRRGDRGWYNGYRRWYPVQRF